MPQMKNVWESCRFSDEIETGNLELHKFAVELHDLTSGTADSVYKDPRKFLDNTYLTSQMRSILADAFNRLEYSRGMPCIIIDTGFGGGKTHTLMLLYHIMSNPVLGFDYIKRNNLDRELGMDHISDARVAAIDCRDVKKSTLWGEIATKLGEYETVREYDESEKMISDLDIIKKFFDEPTVLMIDELPHYLAETLAERIGDTTKSKLTEAFLYKLISAVSSSKNSVLILTLTENQQLYKEHVDEIKKNLTEYKIDAAIGGMRETLSRQTVIRNPVQKKEIYNIVRHRLVREINKEEKQNVVQEYVRYYTEQGLITDPGFHERLEKSYPIHPDFVDILYERVSTISQFNQTRGTLRLLALVLNDIYEKKIPCTLVGTGDINMESSAITDEITSKIGRNEFAKIISTDCIEHAKNLDRDKLVKVIEQISRTIYLHSLHEIPNKKSGITVDQIKLAVGAPGLDTAIIEKALYEDIRTQFWYIQETNGQFYFVDAVNENAIIAEYKKGVDATEADQQIRGTLDRLAKNSSFKSIIWSDDVDDTRNLKLCVFQYDISQNIESCMLNILGHAGDKPRNYPNTIAFAYADQELVRDLKTAARELSAILKTKKDERIKADKNFLTNMSKKEERARGNLDSMCVRTYCRIGYPDGPALRLNVMSYGDMTGRTIGDLVREFLKHKGKLISEIGSDAIRVDSYKKLENIYDEFFSDKRQKFVERTESILEAVRDGIRKGDFGYSESIDESKQKHDGKILQDVDIKFSGYIIHHDCLKPSLGGKEREEDRERDKRKPPIEYKITVSSLTDITNSIDNLLVGAFANVSKDLLVEIELVGRTKIVLTSKLDNLTAVKNIINNLRSYDGGSCTGSLTLSSDDDISAALEKDGAVWK